MSDKFNAEPQISDWPEGYVEELCERELWEAPDEEVLEALVTDHSHMRFGQYFDLNRQQGFYLHAGNGQVTKATGGDSGFVIGALEFPSIEVDNEGNVFWSACEVEQHYVRSGTDKFVWALNNAIGPWFLTTDLEESRGTDWYWLVLSFLSNEDERAFLAAFPEASR